MDEALLDLSAKVDPAHFAKAFNAPVSELSALADSNVVTISRLLEICPAGTIDPTPFLYDTTFYSMCGILSVAAVSNALITKVDRRHFTSVDVIESADVVESAESVEGKK